MEVLIVYADHVYLSHAMSISVPDGCSGDAVFAGRHSDVVRDCYGYFFFQAEDGIRDHCVTGVQTCALPIYLLWEQGRLVASFLVRRKQAAAWLPDGIFWGDVSLIGGPPHPDAAARVGAAVIDARSEERRVGKECRSRWGAYNAKQINTQTE